MKQSLANTYFNCEKSNIEGNVYHYKKEFAENGENKGGKIRS